MTEAGAVKSVKTLKSSGEPGIDEAWSATMRTWRYEPLLTNGQPDPFCQVVRPVLGDRTPAQ